MEKIKQFENDNCYVTTSGKVFKKVKGELVEKAANAKGTGYVTTYVTDPSSGKQNRFGIHRLVMHCFTKYTIPYCREHNLDIMHLDESKDNNHISNLKAGTRSENVQRNRDIVGLHKLSAQMKAILREQHNEHEVSVSQLRERYNIPYTTISRNV